LSTLRVGVVLCVSEREIDYSSTEGTHAEDKEENLSICAPLSLSLSEAALLSLHKDPSLFPTRPTQATTAPRGFAGYW